MENTNSKANNNEECNNEECNNEQEYRIEDHIQLCGFNDEFTKKFYEVLKQKLG